MADDADRSQRYEVNSGGRKVRVHIAGIVRVVDGANMQRCVRCGKVLYWKADESSGFEVGDQVAVDGANLWVRHGALEKNEVKCDLFER